MKKQPYKQKKNLFFNNSYEEISDLKIITNKAIQKFGLIFGFNIQHWNLLTKNYIKERKRIAGSLYNKKWRKSRVIYFFKEKVIDESLLKAYNFINDMAKQKKTFLFVGTKNYVSEYIKNQAIRTKSFYITKKWLGGTLTNFKTIRLQCKKMIAIEKKIDLGFSDNKIKKHEKVLEIKKFKKLNSIFVGIKEMTELPDCVIVLNADSNYIAIKEALKMKIPVVAIINTNNNPKNINYVIPGNNISTKSLLYFTTVLADSICEGKEIEKPIIAFNSKFDYSSFDEYVRSNQEYLIGNTKENKNIVIS